MGKDNLNDLTQGKTPLNLNSPQNREKTQEQPKIETNIPKSNSFKQDDYTNNLMKETDPDLVVGYDIVSLPSKGLFYENDIDKVSVEYLTSEDEDILTTPALIEDGSVIDVILKRKIKTKNINVEELLSGDKNAILLFLRLSSYGKEYNVQVTDPRNGKVFNSTIDLSKIEYKEINETPDSSGFYSVELPMRKKLVRFRLLNDKQEKEIFNKCEAIKEAYNKNYSNFNTEKIISHIISIDGKSDRDYIRKFVTAMPALDAYTIRKKILEITPDLDLTYEFKTKDGFKFKSKLQLGIDFFFPNT